MPSPSISTSTRFLGFIHNGGCRLPNPSSSATDNEVARFQSREGGAIFDLPGDIEDHLTEDSVLHDCPRLSAKIGQRTELIRRHHPRPEGAVAGKFLPVEYWTSIRGQRSAPIDTGLWTVVRYSWFPSFRRSRAVVVVSRLLGNVAPLLPKDAFALRPCV